MTPELMLTLVWRAALIEPHLEYGQCVCQKTADWHLFVRRGQGRGGPVPLLSSAVFLFKSYIRSSVIGVVGVLRLIPLTPRSQILIYDWSQGID